MIARHKKKKKKWLLCFSTTIGDNLRFRAYKIKVQIDLANTVFRHGHGSTGDPPGLELAVPVRPVPRAGRFKGLGRPRTWSLEPIGYPWNQGANEVFGPSKSNPSNPPVWSTNWRIRRVRFNPRGCMEPSGRIRAISSNVVIYPRKLNVKISVTYKNCDFF